ncbi:MAG: DNA (cytosine-5-)-methyltransferase [Clostridium sp.]|uniref:DNA (cytosine-5-)-methyltransferase n=1 Tax=Clostridium TaxID=1485 RepID=UPI00232BC1EF|nr:MULTISPECIES: DNA (cytosine-5-)-methyltransferase [Clostridium]MDB2119971.1 DNA (cytosine-5-)-methyltransferase [Clostridium paraputrificum]MDU2754717.1 DNA (cytosine-5-)-methyltransferase [Clostridium sp.]MDU2899665.1 DNA (cytosine-5-)-methyltransferase [Clostridium sp.]MDU4426362.1 DNA (cytosine-5-)-methyltransferase [Clostridium sp.]MDU4788404.1 DNA (cytosine-5-)-methyltransferase [Clostridium sp.]
MLRVVESFSGIGSQVKALKNAKIEHEIIATIEWDINAIIAYDLIHHGEQDLAEYERLNKDEMLKKLSTLTLSSDGKSPLKEKSLSRFNKNQLMHLLCAIRRSNNLGSITDINGIDLPDNLDLFTYSFPCQDLSIAGAWHGNNSGIDRNANNRSGMLWQVERILLERYNLGLTLPKFLLMENVSNILSNTHKHNFDDWKAKLSEMGYVNYVYPLNAKRFGIPQKRERVYMLSIKVDDNEELKKRIDDFIINNDLKNEIYVRTLNIEDKTIRDILRTNYEKNDIYKKEANESQPNDTESRRKIRDQNDLIYDGNNKYIDVVSTITTKQDRNPNSGVIMYDSKRSGKSNFRYLTPRECFMLMGFDEEDFQKVLDNDFMVTNNRNFFTNGKLYKLAGNSIVVNVLEAIFKQIDYINRYIL